ncbi:hypothetical protein [Paenibacillus sp. MMS20-IR301]|uniref:hypothetical protein n=1 Tax=Paenibacillus sp. MMS20-IR301 TaxID=2895946 RepID=UPI0028F16064|nr:hypothetical protein [Paenibacillus sp. MMS20-IR301]WNS45304.1 hypothetical protein LOS79_08550 [Paenibacillus sp. MMS20-IR301]
MRFSKSAALYSILIVCIVLLMFPKYSFNDPDTFWHIEVGKYMIQHGQILHHAIHTFYGDKLPYVPHEAGFQIIVALLYTGLGWPGIYILTAVCFYILILGLIRLGHTARKESGQRQEHALLLPFVLLISCWIYYNYFKGRPQMISSGMIVWFFVYLREYQLEPRRKYALLLVALSWGIANFHTGVWLVIAVFTGMALLESILNRSVRLHQIIVFCLVWTIGILNPGGLKSLLYILTVTRNNFNLLINEWQPIQFNSLENLPILLLLLFFACTLPLSLQGKPFRYFFMLGILYLGVSNFKQNLFMWLFIPYFAAIFFDSIPINRLQLSKSLVRWTVLKLCLAAGLSVNIAYLFLFPPAIDSRNYPVDEMNYILQLTEPGVRPKVLSRYGSSGYVMFRGGDVLCDGRQDPFITKASTGALGWTAFERSMYGFSEYLPDIVKYDQPDYVIVHSSTSQKLLSGWTREFGQPAFKGTYGSVFAIKHK